MLKKYLFALILITLWISKGNAQLRIASEIGVVGGLVAFQSDYGERGDLETNLGNKGYGLGVVNYLNFSTLSNYGGFFVDHVKLRTELSYFSFNLKHYGSWVDDGNSSIGKRQLKAMTGNSNVINLGFQTEWYFVSIHDFENKIGSFAPYISLGALFNYYMVKTSSTLGEMGAPEATFYKYSIASDGRPFGFSSESKGDVSVIASFGVRYKLDQMSDLQFETRFQYYQSDWVDGLNPNKNLYKDNRANDSNLWINLGYIYYLN